MPAPAPQHVIYRFAPPTQSWTGTSIHTYHCYTYALIEYCHGSSISDTYDFNTLSTMKPEAEPPAYGYGAPDVYAWKQAANSLAPVDIVQRLTCSFSINELPDGLNESELSIVNFTFNNSIDSNPNDWTEDVVLLINVDGTLSFYDGGPYSDDAISVGTTYGLELYYIYNVAAETGVVSIYIDGDLWLTDETAYWAAFWPYTQMIAGIYYSLYRSPCNVTLHMEDIVWTIESSGVARWTMMAPGIVSI